MTTPGNDFINGTTASELLDGLAGDDTIYGREGDDTLIGGEGNDELRGGLGADLYQVGLGHDVIEDDGSDADGADEVFIEGILSFEVEMSLDLQRNLVIFWDGGSVTIRNPFSAADAIETIRFEDGVLLDVSALRPEMRGTRADDSFTGATDAAGQRDDIMRGGEGDERLDARGGDDMLDGGAGNDTLIGGGGNDIYVLGAGHDHVQNFDGNAANRQVAIFQGLAFADVDLWQDTDQNLFVTWASGSADFQFGQRADYLVEEFRFTDRVLDMATFLPEVRGTNNEDAVNLSFNAINPDAGRVLFGFDGDDQLIGGHGDDRLNGGAGDDYLGGNNNGNDTYIVGLGHDIIFDGGGDASDADRIIVEGIASTDVTLSRVGSGGVGSSNVTFSWDDGSVTIQGLWNAGSEIEEIHFADGVTWNPVALQYETLGSVGNDVLVGNEAPQGTLDDVFRIGKGDDIVDGGLAFRGDENGDTVVGVGANVVYMDREGHKEFRDLRGDTVHIEGLDYADVRGETIQLAPGGSRGTYKQVWDGGSITIQNVSSNGSIGLTFVYADGTIRTPRAEDLPQAFAPQGATVNGGADGTILTGDENGTVLRIDTINAGDGDDTLFGLGAGDTLFGEGGDDTLHGGTGDDILYGGAGNDDFIIEITDLGNGITGASGHDTIRSFAESSDKLDEVLLNSVDFANVDMFRNQSDELELHWRDTVTGGDIASSLTIFRAFHATYGVETLTFRDGVVFDLRTDFVESRATDHGFLGGKSSAESKGSRDETLISGVYDNTLEGEDGNDTLIAGAGDDVMRGQEGDDTYVVTAGGNTISDEGLETDVDTLRMEGLTRAEVEIWRDFTGDETLMLTWASGSVEVISPERRIGGVERIVFDDQTLDLTSFAGIEARGGTGDDSLTGRNDRDGYLFSPDEVLRGFEGNDTILAYGGEDTLDGGAGDDDLRGGEGADTYLLGQGHDRIWDIGLTTDGRDRAVFTVASTEADLWRDQSGDLHVTWATGSVAIRDGLDKEDGSGGNKGIEQLVFTDVTLDVPNLSIELRGTQGADALTDNAGSTFSFGSTSSTLRGLDGDDTLDGRDGDDILDGGAGNDSLTGGFDLGDDTFRVGLGHDRVFDYGSSTNDRIEIAATYAETVIWRATNGNLWLEWQGGSVEIFRGFNTFNAIETFAFSDRTLGVNDLDVALRGTFRADTLNGNTDAFGGVDDTILGRGGNDTIRSGIGADTLDGGAGDDTLQGGADDDTYRMSAGTDTVSETSGTDRIIGHAGLRVEDYSFTRNGNNLEIASAAGSMTVFNQFGSSDAARVEHFLTAGGVRVEIADAAALGTVLGAAPVIETGTAAGDILRGDTGEDTLSGADGNDRIVGRTGADDLSGGLGDDTIVGGAGDDVMSGGAGNDDMRGGDGADDMQGDAGDDRLIGRAGDDTLNGGADNDLLRSGNGNDTLLGGIGADRIFGGNDDDFIDGGDGDDEMDGGTGHDHMVGGQGADILRGRAGDDLQFGGAGDDRLRPGTGNDEAHGGDGDDRLFGVGGNDMLLGGKGIDRLDGGRDDDILVGGGGNDFLFGGAGADTFVMRNIDTGGLDKVRDWQSIDMIDVRSYGFADFDALMAASQDVTAGLRFDLGVDEGGGVQALLIEGITSADFTEENVLLFY